MINKENLKKALDELNRFKKRKNQKYNFHSFDGLKKYEYDFLFTVGTRSNGKTTSIQRDIILEDFYNDNAQFIKLCRYKDELKAIHQKQWFTEINIETLHKYDIHIEYRGNTYYINEHKKYIKDGELLVNEFCKSGEVLGKVIPIMRQQNYKSINYEKVNNIIFDEFALQNDYGYSIDEVDNFKSLLSTIVRIREDIKVYFIGNVLTPYNPYFQMFGIDAMKLKAGNTYTFIDNSQYDEPCVVLLEFTKSVTNKVTDIPRLLRLPDNAQVTGLDAYELPKQVIGSNDWLLIALENVDIFNEHYYYGYRFITSIDESITFKKVNNEYQFEHIEYVSVHDIFNDKIYLIRTDIDKNSHGLYVSIIEDLPTYKLADDDIRNHYPIFDISKFRNKDIIFGDVELYKILRERGLKL